MLELNWQQIRHYINIIRNDMISWIISIDEAKIKMQPYIDEINRRWEIIAKEFKKKYKPITFTTLSR